MLTKPALTNNAIHPLLRDRWSPRAFDSRRLPEEQILSLFEAVRWSPSAGNTQPWSFIVVPHDDQDAFERAVSCLNEGNVVWAKDAAVLVIAIAKVLRENGDPNGYALYDLGQAVAHLSLQASAMGLSVHQMAGFSQDRAREVFGIPAGYMPVTFSAIGSQGDHALLPERLRELEQAPRARKSLDSFVFGDTWGQPSRLLVEPAVIE